MLRDKDIRRAVYRCVINGVKNKKITSKSEQEIEDIVTRARKDLRERSYDFSRAEPQTLTQHGKPRYTKKYEDVISTENILCQCIKQILDKSFRIKYPNRNKLISELFNTITAILPMSDFTIVKFDFKEFFNSISSIYVFERYIKDKIPCRFDLDLIHKYVTETRFAYAGLGASNLIAEIIARQFDATVKAALVSKGVLFYARYIDDGIIIFNEHVERDEILCTLKQALSSIFKDSATRTLPMCKTRFNNNKFIHITKRGLSASYAPFDFLGYEFYMRNAGKVRVKYGITESKRNKYSKKIDKMVLEYKNSPRNADDTELLRHRIAAFTRRTVYQGKKYKNKLWKVRGFISNYGELRYLLESGSMMHSTKVFLEWAVKRSFYQMGVDLPYFLMGIQESAYNLYENMKKNKTLLLVEHIGYNKEHLGKLCMKIGISPYDINGRKRSYDKLVRDYLIEVKVGHK